MCGALSTLSPGHRQLWWRDYSVECDFWMYTVSVCQPSLSWTPKCSWWFRVSEWMTIYSSFSVWTLLSSCVLSCDTQVWTRAFPASFSWAYSSFPQLQLSYRLGLWVCIVNSKAYNYTSRSSTMSFDAMRNMYSFFKLGFLNVWTVLSGGQFVSSFKAVRQFSFSVLQKMLIK